MDIEIIELGQIVLHPDHLMVSNAHKARESGRIYCHPPGTVGTKPIFYLMN